MSIHRLAVLTAILTFALLLLGGIVHMTDSGLACPTWPLCFPDQRSVIPDFTGQPLIEYSHRLLAQLVGLATLGLAAWAYRRRRDDAVLWRLSALAAVAVVVQGLLGKLTVDLGLPTLVSTGHLALAMAFFGLLVVIGHRARHGAAPAGAPLPAALRRLIAVTLGAIYAQIVLGALVRHTDSGLVCGTDPLLCVGQLLPAFGPAQLHMTHRLLALAVAALVLAVAWSLWQRGRALNVPRLAWLGALAGGLVLVQVALGALSVMTALQIHTVSAHMAGGALLFALFVRLWLHGRSGAAVETPRAPQPRPTIARAEATP